MANDIEELRFNGTRCGINDERLATKAEQDGFYEEMTVGDAEQLVSTRYVNDAEPYNFRTTGGSADVGNREYLDKIVGGTVAWNQICINGNFANGTNNWTARNATISAENGVLSLLITGSGGFANSAGNVAIAGHKYVTLADINISSGQAQLMVSPNKTRSTTKTGSYETVGSVWESAYTGSSFSFPRVYDMRTSGWDAVKIKNVMVFDLTQMFGTTIADYIYSLEQATAGAGVAFFRKLFPKPYYAYNAGELISVKTSAHNTVGFNQWDEEWEVGGISDSTGANTTNTDRFRSKNYIRVLPNTTYYFRCLVNHRIFYYDESKQYISASAVIGYADAFVTPSNCHFMRFFSVGTTYNNDICINLSWSGYRNGEYEPYVEREYALDSDLELRGIPKLDASNNLYYDGDEYPSDGDVTRKYGIVDLGTLDWTFYSYSGHNGGYSTGLANIAKKYTDMSVIPNAICSKLRTVSDQTFNATSTNSGEDITINATANIKVTCPTATDSASLKTELSGVYLVYELEEPTTETADAYNEIQICDDFGTEEFVDTRDIPVPVGHETRYPANLRDKLQHLPDLADADGYYMIQQSNNDMSLVRFRIPQAPAEDGEYTLKATVSGGTPTYTWESTESEGE